MPCCWHPPSPRQPQTGSFKAEYDGYSHGLVSLKLSAALTLTPTGYSGRLAFHTAGLVGWVSHVESDSQVLGHFTGDRAVPESFSATGVLHGTNRTVGLHWQDGSPVVDTITPPAELERTPIPPEMRAHTIDALSAMAMLVREAGQTGHCDGAETVFDGRRLTHLAAHVAGRELPPPSPKSHYDLPALRCDFEGQELAGFLKNEPEADQRRTRHGTAWLASVVPGAPLVPERVVFEHKQLGQVTLYLTSITGVPGPVAQLPPPSRLQ
ncbi:MAG: DUF3108 domain-containing protein [Rhodospirillales bacterium]